MSNDDGALIAKGTAEQPILLTGATKARGAWQGITFDGSLNELNELTHVTVEYAGSTLHDVDGAAVRLIADSSGVQLRLTHTTLRQSQGWGLFAAGSALLPGFDANTFTENGLGPVSAGSLAVHQLLPGSSYTGNDVDRLLVRTDYVPDAASWADLGLPYALTDLLVAHGVWTVEPGVTLIMLAPNGRLHIGGDEAALHAVGTAEKPIVITGGEPTAGYWQGIVFSGSLNAANVLDHVTIEHAGSAPVQYPGAVFATSDRHGVRVTVTNCTIQHNAGYGVWLGMYAQVNGDVEGANTFADNGAGGVFIQP